MDDHAQEGMDILAELETLNVRLLELQYEIAKLPLDSLEETDLCDIGFAQRQLERKFDEAKKESGAHQRAIGAVLCKKLMLRFAQDMSGELKARGTLSSATPNTKTRPITPKKGTPEYLKMLEALGIHPEIAESGALQIHYEHMTGYLKMLSERGDNPPEGLSSQPEFSVTYRKNRKEE